MNLEGQLLILQSCRQLSLQTRYAGSFVLRISIQIQSQPERMRLKKEKSVLFRFGRNLSSVLGAISIGLTIVWLILGSFPSGTIYPNWMINLPELELLFDKARVNPTLENLSVAAERSRVVLGDIRRINPELAPSLDLIEKNAQILGNAAAKSYRDTANSLGVAYGPADVEKARLATMVGYFMSTFQALKTRGVGLLSLLGFIPPGENLMFFFFVPHCSDVQGLNISLLQCTGTVVPIAKQVR